MVKETIECENVFTGEKETVDLYFHLTEGELITLDLAENNKYSAMKDKQIDPEINRRENVALFEKLIAKAYGQKSETGKFIKTQELRDEFLASDAYSQLLKKFISGEIDINKFIMGCLPKNISSRILLTEDGSISIKD